MICAIARAVPDRAPSGTVILGLGNTLLSDDGIGVRLAQALRAEGCAAECVDGGTLGFRLAQTVATAERCLFVDAADLRETPGTTRLLRPAAVARWRQGRGRATAHEAGLCDLIDMLALEDRLPADWAVLAIQPGTIGWGEALSDAVARAVPEALGLARGWIGAAAMAGKDAR